MNRVAAEECESCAAPLLIKILFILSSSETRSRRHESACYFLAFCKTLARCRAAIPSATRAPAVVSLITQ